MAQSWVCAGMQGVGAVSGRGWRRAECEAARLNQIRAPQKVRCNNEEEAKKKRAPVRLPGGRQVPTYGGSGGGSKSPPGLGQFKPPNMFGPPPPAIHHTEEDAAKVDATLERIRGGFGTWQERAAGISELHRIGMGLEDVYGEAYVPAPTQTSMVVAAQVYQSMVQMGCSPDVLSWFDESKVDILYPLRTLSAQQRKLAAEYVRDNDLDVSGAQELARAIKDHERRPQGREGFTPVPGDCLAFSLHRAAGETSNAEERSLFVQRGMAVAVTDSAKQRFSEYR